MYETVFGLAATIATALVLAAANAADAIIAIAIPLNTGLLVILTLLSHKNGRKIDAAHVSIANAAIASASAAKAAEDSARITKEIGGTLRVTEAPIKH